MCALGFSECRGFECTLCLFPASIKSEQGQNLDLPSSRPLHSDPRLASVGLLFPYLVKISNNLIENPETLHALVVAVQLCVEVREVWNGSEKDPNSVILLTIQFLEDREVEVWELLYVAEISEFDQRNVYQ